MDEDLKKIENLRKNLKELNLNDEIKETIS